MARRVLRSGIWALFATLDVGLMPRSVYNSTIGMANGIFGLLIAVWLYYAIRTGWVELLGGDASEMLKAS